MTVNLKALASFLRTNGIHFTELSPSGLLVREGDDKGKQKAIIAKCRKLNIKISPADKGVIFE